MESRLLTASVVTTISKCHVVSFLAEVGHVCSQYKGDSSPKLPDTERALSEKVATAYLPDKESGVFLQTTYRKLCHRGANQAINFSRSSHSFVV
ncbi:hypothetical protein Y1Q_0004340 [Alligator mississippiensis]|uniref:Uncharacterized protein n=1 Tax=Alligator mississippiensis TaxID=8496 RepID=A0A151MIF8_ALLMI|nr:hypothetical protein Y1Q_0004340 [Alligator mississippiensis]